MQVMAQPLKTSFLVGKIFLVFDFDLGKKRKCSHLSYDFGALVMTTLDTAHKVKNVPVKIFYRVTKNENFPESKIFVAKTFRIKRVNRVDFQIRDKCA